MECTQNTLSTTFFIENGSLGREWTCKEFPSLKLNQFIFHLIDPPRVYVKPDEFTVNETGEFLLFCEYDANPVSLQSVRWLQNNTVLNLNQSRFDGGNPELTALLVRNATRDDKGLYVCELSNQVGTGTSERGVFVDVQCEYIARLLSLQTRMSVCENVRQDNLSKGWAFYLNIVPFPCKKYLDTHLPWHTAMWWVIKNSIHCKKSFFT